MNHLKDLVHKDSSKLKISALTAQKSPVQECQEQVKQSKISQAQENQN